jgi:hypothetical protein
MSTVKLFVPNSDFSDVCKHVSESGVKYYPIRRHGEMVGSLYRAGYLFEMDKDHPIVSFLILKFDLKVSDWGSLCYTKYIAR